RDGGVLCGPCQGYGSQQGHERCLDGHVQVPGEREENRASRRLWSRERGDGLPRRRSLGCREERPLPDAEEHLATAEMSCIARCGGQARGRAIWRAALVLVLVISPGAVRAQERLPVVTTTGDLRSLTEAVGGARVEVTALVPPGFDPEEYQPRPQDLVRVRKAQAVVRVGLDFDLWADRLLAQASASVRRGMPGYVDASFGIATLDVRGLSIGGDGHAHGSGNPHYWLDPRNAEIVTANIQAALASIDPAHAEAYTANRLAFLSRLEGKLKDWDGRLAAL